MTTRKNDQRIADWLSQKFKSLKLIIQKLKIEECSIIKYCDDNGNEQIYVVPSYIQADLNCNSETTYLCTDENRVSIKTKVKLKYLTARKNDQRIADLLSKKFKRLKLIIQKLKIEEGSIITYYNDNGNEQIYVVPSYIQADLNCNSETTYLCTDVNRVSIKTKDNAEQKIYKVPPFTKTDLDCNLETEYLCTDVNGVSIKTEVKTEIYEDIPINDPILSAHADVSDKAENSFRNVPVKTKTDEDIPINDPISSAHADVSANVENSFYVSDLTDKRKKMNSLLNPSNPSLQIGQQLENSDEYFHDITGNHSCLQSESQKDYLHPRMDSFISCDLSPYKTSRKTYLMGGVSSNYNGGKDNNFGSQCSYKAASNKYLKKHVSSVHKNGDNDSKILRCAHCSYETALSGDFNRHVSQVHNGEKPFSCGHCSYKSSRSSNMKTHVIAIHNGETPFSCQFCSYKTAYRGSVKKHYNSVHSRKKDFFAHTKISV